MDSNKKQVIYSSTNTYETRNELTHQTKNVWIVLHGIGYLSSYFLKYFDELNAEENYIIAPQAPSKYYLNNTYRHVGASWLTKENTTLEIQNVITYLDAVLEAENLPANCNLIVFGYSQGVSIAARWVSKRKLKCNQLVLYAGRIPSELNTADFSFLLENDTKITFLVGNQDEYISAKLLKTESEKINTLFNDKAEQIIFEGGHQVKKELINSLV